MKNWSATDRFVLILNTAGFIGYLAWLAKGQQRIFYTQEGVLYLLPCLPFFFVYAFLYHKTQVRPEGDIEKGEAPKQD